MRPKTPIHNTAGSLEATINRPIPMPMAYPVAAIAIVCFRESSPSTKTRFPPENGLRSSGAIPRSAPESKISPEAFLATSIVKMPIAVSAS